MAKEDGAKRGMKKEGRTDGVPHLDRAGKALLQDLATGARDPDLRHRP